MINHVHALPEGCQLHEYTITGTLGFGGFGITYSARDRNLEKQVAIKEYLPSELAVRQEGSTVSAKSDQDKASFEWGLERFIDEARLVAKFDHQNIVRIHRFFEQNGTGYIVMEYVDGPTLASVLNEKGVLPETDIKAWLWPIVNGLQVVHSRGYLHRDIKPQNIMMRKDMKPVLLDFGAARLAMGGRTRSLTAIMTPGYAPLEQYESHGSHGPWTDVYALGAVIYCCINGSKPANVLDRITKDQLVPLEPQSHSAYSVGLLKGVEWALKMSKEDRPQSLEAWMEVVEGLDEEPTQVINAPPAPAEPAEEPTIVQAVQAETSQVMPETQQHDESPTVVQPRTVEPDPEPPVPGQPLPEKVVSRPDQRPLQGLHRKKPSILSAQAIRKTLIAAVIVAMISVFWKILPIGGEPAEVAGDAQTQFNQAQMYENGWGREKNLVEAERWYRLAASQGHTGAQERLDQLSQK
jgi:serine/threonine protein kinase